MFYYLQVHATETNYSRFSLSEIQKTFKLKKTWNKKENTYLNTFHIGFWQKGKTDESVCFTRFSNKTTDHFEWKKAF